MDNPATLSLGLMMIGVFAGGGAWFVSFRMGLIQNLTIALPLMSVGGGLSGYLSGWILARRKSISPSTRSAVSIFAHGAAIVIGTVVLVEGLIARSESDILLGLFLVTVTLIPLPPRRLKVASLLWMLAFLLAATLFAYYRDLYWFGISLFVGLAGLSAIYIQKNSDKLARSRRPHTRVDEKPN
jgi:hypothetical protein